MISKNQKGSAVIVMIVAIVVLIVIIAGLLYYFLVFKAKNNEVKTSQNFQGQPTQTEIKTAIDPATLEYKEFVNTDGNFKIKYPQKWIKSEVADTTNLVGAELTNRYKMEIPISSTLTGNNLLVSLSVIKIAAPKDLSADEVFGEMIAENSKLGFSTKILNKSTSIDGKVTTFETITKAQNNTELHSKEKLYLLDPEGDRRPGAIVTFQTFEQNWNEYQKIGDYLLDSVVMINIIKD